MKLIDILKENYEIEESPIEMKEVITKNYDVVDEVGKFFVVSKPGTKSTKEEIMFEADPFSLAERIKNGLTYENIMGMYKNKSDASRIATEVLKARDTQLDELKASMEEFRTSKKDIDEKKVKAKELIQKLKLNENQTNVVYIIADNGGELHDATLDMTKAEELKKEANYDLGMRGSRNSAYIKKMKLS